MALLLVGEVRVAFHRTLEPVQYRGSPGPRPVSKNTGAWSRWWNLLDVPATLLDMMVGATMGETHGEIC